MGDRFKLYIIYSELGLTEISNIIALHTSYPEEMGPMRKDYTRNVKTGKYQESNRRFIIITEDVFKRLTESGYNNEENDKFYIDDYEIRGNNKPPGDSVMHYYFPDNEVNKPVIENRMKFIQKLGLFSEKDYSIHDGVVEFSNKVDDYTRIIVKIILDDFKCRVSWCRKCAFKNVKHSF